MRKGRRNIFRFSFVQNQRAGRAQGFPRQRDSEAFTELYRALGGDGYQHYETILNYREEQDEASQYDPSIPLAQQMSRKDLIVVATRPPINEEPSARKRILTSNTWLERRILEACADYFAISRRDSIVLHEGIQHTISSSCSIDAELKTDVEVYTRPWATYKYPSGKSQRTSEDRFKSPVYLLRLPHIAWDGRQGPGLLVVFGMSAPLSLAWSYILRTRYPHLLGSHRFLMADLTLPKRLNPTPINLEAFCSDWEVDTIFDLETPVVEDTRIEEELRESAKSTDPGDSYSYAARGRS